MTKRVRGNRRKSLVSKDLRAAGQAREPLTPCGVRVYGYLENVLISALFLESAIISTKSISYTGFSYSSTKLEYL